MKFIFQSLFIILICLTSLVSAKSISVEHHLPASPQVIRNQVGTLNKTQSERKRGGNTAEDLANFYTLDKSIESKNLVEQFNLIRFASAATKDEIAAIHRCTVGIFQLTVAAYSGKYTAVQKSWMNLIKSGMVNLSPANTFVGKVYRGSNLGQTHLQPFLDAWGSRKKIIKIPALQSTSKLKSVANYFINKFKTAGKSEVMFEIQSKTGVYIDDISEYGKNLGPVRHPSTQIQEEVLLFDNRDFQITNLQTISKSDGTVRYVIEMKEL